MRKVICGFLVAVLLLSITVLFSGTVFAEQKNVSVSVSITQSDKKFSMSSSDKVKAFRYGKEAIRFQLEPLFRKEIIQSEKRYLPGHIKYISVEPLPRVFVSSRMLRRQAIVRVIDVTTQDDSVRAVIRNTDRFITEKKISIFMMWNIDSIAGFPVLLKSLFPIISGCLSCIFAEHL